MLKSVAVSALVLVLTVFCKSPPVENIYRKEERFLGGINVPVALLVNEWAGKVKVMGSAWLVDGGRGVLLSAKHVTDAFLNDQIELGGNECKIFLNGIVYDCIVVRVPPHRDAVVLKITNPFKLSELPIPYKIGTERVKVGEKVFVQGFHPHPNEIRDSNEKEGFKDLVVPIFKTFYERRYGNRCIDTEVVFDKIKVVVTKLNIHVKIKDQENDPMEELRYAVNTYFSVVTLRNHKFSFAGLSGGVVVRLNKNKELEAIGIITAEKPVKPEYDKSGNLVSPCGMPPMVANTIMVTPIESVADEIEYARQIR